MQLQIDNQHLQEALKVIQRLAPPISGNVTIESDGKKVFMHSGSETSRCSVNMPAEVEGKANTFAVSLNALRDATKGRQKLNIEYSKTLCKISSGSYKCELSTVDAIELDHQTEEKIGKPIKLTSEQAQWLKQAVATVALKPTELLATYMPLSIKLTEKGAFVACYDTNHMAFISSNEINGAMETCLPLDIVGAVLDTFGKAVFKIETSKSNLYVSNALVKVVLSLPQEDEGALKLEEVIDAAKGSKASKGQEFEVDRDDLIAFLDNARAVATKERSEIKLSLEPGKMRLDVLTANGSTRATIKASCTKKAVAMIDFEFLDEAVRKSNATVIMKLVMDEFIAFKLKAGTVIVSLNQSEASE